MGTDHEQRRDEDREGRSRGPEDTQFLDLEIDAGAPLGSARARTRGPPRPPAREPEGPPAGTPRRPARRDRTVCRRLARGRHRGKPRDRAARIGASGSEAGGGRALYKRPFPADPRATRARPTRRAERASGKASVDAPNDLAVPSPGSTTARRIVGAYLRRTATDLLRLPDPSLRVACRGRLHDGPRGPRNGGCGAETGARCSRS